MRPGYDVVYLQPNRRAPAAEAAVVLFRQDHLAYQPVVILNETLQCYLGCVVDSQDLELIVRVITNYSPQGPLRGLDKGDLVPDDSFSRR